VRSLVRGHFDGSGDAWGSDPPVLAAPGGGAQDCTNPLTQQLTHATSDRHPFKEMPARDN